MTHQANQLDPQTITSANKAGCSRVGSVSPQTRKALNSFSYEFATELLQLLDTIRNCSGRLQNIIQALWYDQYRNCDFSLTKGDLMYDYSCNGDCAWE